MYSSGVIRVDADVFRGKIRRPKTARAGSQTEIDMNGEIVLCQVLMGDVLIIPWREGALFADGVRAVGNIDFGRIDGHARISDRCEDAPPVWIAPCPCSLDQR